PTSYRVKSLTSTTWTCRLLSRSEPSSTRMTKSHAPCALGTTIMGSPLPAPLPCSSLIICSRNRPRLLVDTIRSVLKGDEVPTELVIVDQSDAPYEAFSQWRLEQACELRYLWKPSLGLSRGRNEGIAAARHNLLVIIDDDMFVASRWFGT